MTDFSDFNAQVIAEFRANNGKVAQFGDADLVILHTIGAKSGKLRETPLVTMVEGDEITVFASKAGAPSHPDWYFNLKANPEIDVELAEETFEANVAELPADVAAERIARMGQQMPQFNEYVTNAAPRIIPAFSITRR